MHSIILNDLQFFILTPKMRTDNHLVTQYDWDRKQKSLSLSVAMELGKQVFLLSHC